VFGEEKETSGQFSTLANTRALDLHQGFLQIDSIFNSGFGVRLGRMELKYGTERIIGPVDWNNTGRSFDGLLIRSTLGRTTADMFVARTGEFRTPPAAATPAAVAGVRDEGQTLYGAYATAEIGGASAIDLYALYQTHLARGSSGEAELKRATIGTYLRSNLSGLTLEIEFAGQYGRKNGKKISACLLAGSLAFRTDYRSLEDIRGSVEMLSGTPEGSDQARTFDPPYPTGHKFHGWMDYFISIPLHTYDRGLLDINLGAQGGFSNEITYMARAHTFSLMLPRSGEKELGQELDITVRYRYAEPLALDLGLSAFMPGGVLRGVFGGADMGLWGYGAATFTF
jgi:hypothetical protein